MLVGNFILWLSNRWHEVKLFDIFMHFTGPRTPVVKNVQGVIGSKKFDPNWQDGIENITMDDTKLYGVRLIIIT